jgi:hypothetical protein
MSDAEVRASLLSPVTIQPTQPHLPHSSDEQPLSCVDRSEDPRWEIENLSYHHSYTQIHDDPAQSYFELFFDLTNLANEQKVSCFVTVDDIASVGSNHTTRWINCGTTSASASSGATSVTGMESLQVSFDVENNLFGLKQTWRCADGTPDTFAGAAYLIRRLDCGDPVNLAIIEDGWVTGATSFYNCSFPALTLSGYTDPPAMPHTSYTRSCTLNSLNATSLVLKEYEVEYLKILDGVALEEITKFGTFTLYNPGSGDYYTLWRLPVQDDGTWHECAAGSEPLPWQVVGCQYLLDRANNYLGFQVQWYCDDRDPEHPYVSFPRPPWATS